MTDTFPRQNARTRRFTLGAPRDFRVSRDGSRVAFLRSMRGDDPVNRLWVLDVPSGREREVADPGALLGADDGDLPAAERARRERAREQGGGIVAYDSDPDLRTFAFALSGRVFLATVGDAGSADQVRELPSSGDAFDPRLDPTGSRVAYVSGRTLRCTSSDGDADVVSEAKETVSWGSAEFVAAEEMGRSRGFWWAPDGQRLLAARVDVAPVDVWHIASPVDPMSEPTVIRYPAAGTPNADVSLAIIGLDGSRIEVDWRGDEFEYLCDALWGDRSDPTLVVQSRDQRTVAILAVDPATGAVRELQRQRDDAWVELVAGAPAWAGERLVTVVDRDDTRRVCVDGEPISPVGLQVRRVLHVDEVSVLAAATTDPTQVHVWRFGIDGSAEELTVEPGVHGAAGGGDTVVLSSATVDQHGSTVAVWRAGQRVGVVASHAEVPLVDPRPAFHVVGTRALHAALVLPSNAIDGPLPVLMDPYGGPHALRVQRTKGAFATSQWFADQGYAVIVCDGRGTPARGPAWEREIRGDFASHALSDQVDALHALAERDERLDLSRVAIRGWSFGGYLAALAVLDRPDVFHAAVAGAPVTEWGLYDTHYTERYLGHPDVEPENYRRSDLTPRAGQLERPLLLVHGLADDNVVVAHTLRLSRALLEHGRPHEVMPLSGVTHMTSQETVAENLLRLEIDFLSRALAR